MKGALYNEIDPYAAQWLRNLIAARHIAPGDVNENSIEDLLPYEIKGYAQVHFFAGIGVWSRALRRAGWDDSRPVWTGSCPCQPFSTAGKGGGFADERHLWPSFFHLIEARRPVVVFGEQVASKDGYSWLDLVQADLEGTGYTVGAVVAPAAGFGAPHQRHRMYWAAYTNNPGSQGWEFRGNRTDQRAIGARGVDGGLAHSPVRGQPGGLRERGQAERPTGKIGGHGSISGLDDCECFRRETSGQKDSVGETSESRVSSVSSFWSNAEWIYCRDEKYRPAEPGTFPLAHGAPARVGRLRAYGNAICAPQAEEFIRAYLDLTVNTLINSAELN